MKVSLYVRDHSTRSYRKPKSTEPMGTIYVLRYGSTWETIKAANWAEATTARLRKEIDLVHGWRPQPAPKRTPVREVPMLDTAIDAYLSEIQQQRKPKTHAAYATALRYFYASCGNKPLQDIRRSDLLDFAVYLREEKGQSPRSTYNKFEGVMSFLKRHDITGKSLRLSSHDWPQYTETEPEIYEQEVLDKFFAACTDDEHLLFEFFLMSGLREQEVIFASDKSLFLDICKAVAKRAGIPEEEVCLHKFRATFCTRALWGGIDLRTVQSWMGHVDLASTMRYLKPNQRVDAQRIAAIWN